MSELGVMSVPKVQGLRDIIAPLNPVDVLRVSLSALLITRAKQKTDCAMSFFKNSPGLAHLAGLAVIPAGLYIGFLASLLVPSIRRQ